MLTDWSDLSGFLSRFDSVRDCVHFDDEIRSTWNVVFFKTVDEILQNMHSNRRVRIRRNEMCADVNQIVLFEIQLIYFDIMTSIKLSILFFYFRFFEISNVFFIWFVDFFFLLYASAMTLIKSSSFSFFTVFDTEFKN